MKKYLSLFVSAVLFQVAVISNVKAQTGTWTQIATPAPHANNGVCLLMTDGTVICKNTAGGGNGTGWDRLTPDIHGSYINGTWDTIRSMINDRLYFSSQVLPSGKVYAAGGEYGAGGTAGEVYDPVANTWTLCGPIPAGWNIYDGNSELLYNGNVLEGPQIGSSDISNNILLWSPTTLNYTVGPNSFYSHDEAAWLKMPDSSILFVGIESDSSNRYIPQTGNWIHDANVPGFLYDPLGEEAGSAFMLPNGQGIFFGATPFNALYTPSGNTNPGTWAAADSFPVIQGTYVSQDDAPGAMMVNGHILLAVSPAPTSSSEFIDPIYFVEYDYTTNTFAQVKSIIPITGGDSIPGQTCYQAGMLGLPDGTVLVSVDQSSSYSYSYLIYTPGSAPIAQGKPTINSILPMGCPNYMVTGKLFNGISEGQAYGDDWQNATNYPLIRLSNGTDVFYTKTTNWNRLGALQTDSLEDTAYFSVPNIPGGTYSLVVVVNGFASNPTNFSVLGLTSLTQTNITCRIDTGTATVTASGGLPPYTYLWSDANSQTNATATGLTAGTYTITLTDNNGCSFSPTVTITQPPFFIAVNTKVVLEATCPFGGTDSAFASAGYAPYTYLWNDANSQTGSVATGLSAGTYTVTATDTSGCSATASCTITQTVPINISTSVTSPGCYGGTGSITATLSGALIINTFSYTGNVQNITLPPSLTTVTVAVTGAAGGSSFEALGGSGASFAGVCPVTAGDILSIAVGGVGGSSVIDDGDGGGGGTFVYDSNTVTPIAIAGGGGGSGFTTNAGGNGGIMVTAPYSATNGVGGNGANGTGGNGGAAGLTNSEDDIVGGGGGAGWISNGANGIGTDSSFGGFDEALPGHFAGGRYPAAFEADSNRGGYGGGGGGAYNAGGGGGGYNGGGGGDDSIIGGGGGGGSYLNGTVLGAPTATNTGNGYATISYTLPTIGGTPPYTYLWSPNGGTSLTATGLTAGTYTLTVTDNNGCTESASAVITQPAQLNVAVGISSGPVCSGTGSLSANLIIDTTTVLTKNFVYNGVVQNFTVPAAITSLTVAVTGASGGNAFGGGGGPGASFTGICAVTPGNIISLAVGGMGGTTTSDDGDGGGGGTFVYDSLSITPFAIAGGGGGAGFTGDTGGHGGTIIVPPYTATNGYGGNGANGTGGNGGASGLFTSTDGVVGGGGGTGWLSNGLGGIGEDTTFGGSNEALPGHFAGGSYPRVGFVDANVGGFGGGGGGAFNAGGGGGGYNGGGGGDDSIDGGGGGGGSYLNGTILVPATATNSGNGYASISYHVPGGTPPYTYSWSPNGGTGTNATGLSAGTYTLTVTDNNGCSATAIATLTQPSVLSVSAVTTAMSCSGGSGSDSAAVSGGTSPFTYLWSDANSQTAASATGLSAGTYTAIVTDSNGCSATASNILRTIIDVTGLTLNNVSCNGGSNGSATSSVSGGAAPYTYMWNDGNSQTSVIATGLAAGGYIITVSDNLGCSETASVTITQPGALSLSISSSGTNCSGSSGSATVSISGGTSPYLYSWSNGGGSGSSATGLSAGIYSIMVSDSCGSSASASVIIILNQVTITIASRVIEVCDGYGYITAHAAGGGTPPYTYSWAPSGGTNLATTSNLGAGTYTITATDNTGCTGSASEVITLPPQLTVTANMTSSITCYEGNNGSVSSTPGGGTSPYTYSWSPGGGTNSSAAGLPAGVYVITVTDSNGCVATSSVSLNQPSGMTIVQDSVNQTQNMVCNGSASVNITGGGAAPYTYSWTPGGATTASVTGQCAGVYCCTITDNNGCSQSTCVTIRNATGLAGVNNSQVIHIYPDPNNGLFTVTGVATGQVIELYNYLGQKISSLIADKPTINFDISDKANGIYLIRIENKDGSLVTQQKMVKTQ